MMLVRGEGLLINLMRTWKTGTDSRLSLSVCMDSFSIWYLCTQAFLSEDNSSYQEWISALVEGQQFSTYNKVSDKQELKINNPLQYLHPYHGTSCWIRKLRNFIVQCVFVPSEREIYPKWTRAYWIVLPTPESDSKMSEKGIIYPRKGLTH